MNKLELKGEELLSIGLPQGKAIGLALRAIEENNIDLNREDVLTSLKRILQHPDSFIQDAVFGALAVELVEVAKQNEIIQLKECGNSFKIFGADNIDQGAINQMTIAMHLPISVAGALMPDAHQGYGLPIGGVLATKNAIIPYGVGVDIGCRMALSIFDIPAQHLLENKSFYQTELLKWTKFGAGAGWHGKFRANHSVLDRPEFNSTPIIKSLHEKAAQQLGTSGGGNHFVEFGIIEFESDDQKLNMNKGKYLALLTHSGSRGFGATLAGHFTRIAKEKCKLPQVAANLAYLDLNSSEGQEYWLAMNLAGDYASACHEVIHDRLAKAIGGQVITKIENHHNFAWKEKWNHEEVIVHRKGATPASKDVMGIIPGSMTAPGFLVRGKGETTSINSASHGAGRQMSRTQALKNITKKEMKDVLEDHGVTLIGAGLDEAPMAYKSIETVMAAQYELVDVIATFTPKLVRMADDGSRED